MNASSSAVVCLLTILAVRSARSQQVGATEGAIIDQKPCAFGPYEQQSGFTKRFYSKEEYESTKSNALTECSRIEYSSTV